MREELKATEEKMVTLTDMFDPALLLFVGGPWEAPFKPSPLPKSFVVGRRNNLTDKIESTKLK